MNVIEARERADKARKSIEDEHAVAAILKQVEKAADQGLYKTIVDGAVAVRWNIIDRVRALGFVCIIESRGDDATTLTVSWERKVT